MIDAWKKYITVGLGCCNANVPTTHTQRAAVADTHLSSRTTSAWNLDKVKTWTNPCRRLPLREWPSARPCRLSCLSSAEIFLGCVSGISLLPTRVVDRANSLHTHCCRVALFRRTEEHEPVHGIGFRSIRSSWHGKLKVCDPESPCDCRNPHLVPPSCTLLTSAFVVECAELTCWCLVARRMCCKSSFGASCLSCSDTASRSASSADLTSSCTASSTS